MNASPDRHPLRVLLATDGSPDSRGAAEWLSRFPLPPASTVLVLSVVSIPPSPIAFPGLEEFKRSLLADGRHACEDAAAVLEPRWPGVEIRVRDGDAREQTLKAAEDWRPDLAVFGRRGLGGLERMLLGSVSLAAARHLTCPVLVVHGQPRELHRIVVGVDGSEEARRAIGFVESLALGPEVEVLLVAVAESMLVPGSLSAAAREAFRPFAAEMDKQQLASLREMLGRTVGRLETRTHVRTQTLLGDPAGSLIEEGTRADLLAVGSRGLGAVRRLLLGTVSEKVLNHASCPVLIVKG
jgi:nucleotide-binding universal stress UspA family protein